MIKLKRGTWYYFYTDGDNIFMSEDAPIRENQIWWHPKSPLKIVGSPFYIGEQNSIMIAEFKDVTYAKT